MRNVVGEEGTISIDNHVESDKPCINSGGNKKSLAEQMGWILRRKLGEGHTRVVYEALQKRGDIYERAVVKIPKDHANSRSVQTLINSSRLRVNNESESYFLIELFNTYFDILFLEKLIGNQFFESTIALSKKNNLSDIFTVPLSLESILLEDGSVVESYFDGIDLKKHIEVYGPMRTHGEVINLCNKLISGSRSLYKRRMLHRDIKPSNVLISRKDESIKLIDLQNAIWERDSLESSLPTRGGTKYCDPLVLKRFLNNESSRITFESDLFSIGATIFYALTGEDLLDFEFVHDKQGIPIKIGEENIFVSIRNKDGPIDDINLEDYTKIIIEKIQKAPRKYRRFLGGLLILNSNDNWLRSIVGSSELSALEIGKSNCSYEGLLGIRAPNELEHYLAECEGSEVISAGIDNLGKLVIKNERTADLADYITSYAKRHGQLEYSAISMDDWSKSQKPSAHGRRYIFHKNHLEIRILEYSHLVMKGIGNASWSEKYWWYLDIFDSEERIFSGKKLLREEYCEGGSGDFSSVSRGGSDWEITKSHPLEEVIHHLSA